MKSLRTREEQLDELKKHRKSVGAKTDAAEKKLNKMNPENKNLTQQTELLNGLRDQIKSLDSEIMTEEAALGDAKRKIAREFMALKFGGLLELSQKGTVSG
jgi:DNA repair ATPase RecN